MMRQDMVLLKINILFKHEKGLYFRHEPSLQISWIHLMPATRKQAAVIPNSGGHTSSAKTLRIWKSHTSEWTMKSS